MLAHLRFSECLRSPRVGSASHAGDIRTLIRGAGELTRGELVELTGLARSTINNAVAQLLALAADLAAPRNWRAGIAP